MISEQMVQDKARNQMVRETAMIESEYPAHTPAGITSQSGYCVPTSGSAAILLAIPSGTWFKPRTLIVDNQNALQNHLVFYEGGSASACSGILIPGIYVDGKSTAIIALDCLTAGKDIYVQAETVGNTAVRIGGILVASMAE
jgi:hypothetical protein